jgi:hypothetical protein
MADQLLDITGYFALDLATPIGARTRPGRDSTTDLAFTASTFARAWKLLRTQSIEV